MQETKELNALLSLIDDPDTEVYESVSGKLMDYGKPIIPNLEHLWENQPDERVQERIEFIIKRLQLAELSNDFKNWKESGCKDLLEGAYLVAKYDQPDLCYETLIESIDSLKKNIWLELNSYLTPLEQAKVLKNILYQFFGLRGALPGTGQTDDFFLNKVIHRKQGNSLSIGILYHALCKELNIESSLICFPNIFMLAFYSSGLIYDPQYPAIRESIQFFVDPLTGKPFTQHDIDVYFERIKKEPIDRYFIPLSNEEIIQHLLQETARFYREEKNDDVKSSELLLLAELLVDKDKKIKNNLS